MKTYEDGLNEAWKAARKIACLSSDDGYTMEELIEIFGLESISIIFKEQSANEAITKIKEYENRIGVGDEVKWQNGIGVIIEYDGYSTTVMKPNGTATIVYNETALKKTGRHFPQIEEVLKKLKEED